MDREHQHVFPTWEIYPRVHYFRGRYLDLHWRFHKVMKALPERFHKKSLMSKIGDLCRYLGNFLQVTVVGKEDLSPGQFVASVEALKDQTDVPGQGTGEIHICICHAKVRDLSKAGLQDIGTVLQYLSADFLLRCSGLSTILIVCETDSNFHENDIQLFRSKVLETVQKLTGNLSHPFEILIGPEMATSLPSAVSYALEKQIIDEFSEIFMLLQTFIRKDIRCDQENIAILESEIVVNTIQSFLRNSHNLIDSKAVSEHTSFFDLVLQTLCRQVTCAAVSPMSAKHNIPDRVCYELLQEINFEQDLQNSFSPNTIHHLRSVEEHAQNLIKLKSEGKDLNSASQTKCFSFDFILYMLQKDMAKAIETTEKKLSAMNRVTTVMRKMIFEIRGYLKQAIVPVEIMENGQRELTLEDITDKLRKDIMGTRGVYGMGTLYGQLEVHLKKELEEDEVKAAKANVAEVMKDNRFAHPYIIKTVGNNPEQFARIFYEPGSKIVSPFPDDEKQSRVGTLGCFIKGSDDIVYAVTCAHVVDPQEKNEHEVYIETQSGLFAISSRHMLFYGRDVDLHLADFAAVKVLPNKLNMCSFLFKDEFGNSKRARLASELSSELVGDFVFKYGASTECTKGIIASNSYLFNGQTSYEHLVIVEPLPVPSDDIRSILTNEGNDSQPSSQVGEGAPMDTEPDITDLLHNSSNENGIESNKTYSKQGEADVPGENGIASIGTSRKQEGTDVSDDNGIESNRTSNKQREADIPDVNGIEPNTTSDKQGGNDLPDQNGIETSKSSGKQEGADVSDEKETEIEMYSACSNFQNIRPRPETGAVYCGRNSETGFIRNVNETLSGAFSDKYLSDTPQHFAAQGDSGSIVCKRDLLSDEIVAISMVTAGNFKLKSNLNSESDDNKCLSVRMDRMLAKLQERCGDDFMLCQADC